MSAIIERRFFHTTEIRAVGDTMSIEGIAVNYNSKSVPIAGFRERIAPGAFARSLASGANVTALINHDPNLVLGKSRVGSLRLTDSPSALRFRCDMPDTSYARDLLANIRAGNITQCSFAFVCRQDDWNAHYTDDEELPLRTVRDADLYDVSAVTSPCYEDTQVDAASRCFPNGVSAELRSRLRFAGIVLPFDSDSERNRMYMRLELAKHL